MFLTLENKMAESKMIKLTLLVRAMLKHRELLNFNITIIKISEYNLIDKTKIGIDSENPSVQENMLNIEPSPPKKIRWLLALWMNM